MQRLIPALPHGWARRACTALCILVPGISTATADTPLIYAELAPQAWLAERLIGDDKNLRVLVPPNHLPELYAPTPRQVAELTQATLYLRCGTLGGDNAWIGLLRTEGLHIVECCHALQNADGDTDDPHPWTDPLLALKMAARMRAALVAVHAQGAEHYLRNYRLLEQELHTLDLRIRQRLTTTKKRHFLVAHPSWQAFAARYALAQISLEPLHTHTHGAEPSSRHIIEVIELGRTHDIRAVFVQPGSTHNSAQIVARNLRVPLRTLDPLHPDYAHNLLRVAERIAETLQ